MTINLTEKISLELTAIKYAKLLYAAVDNNREHLAEFLPWVGNMQSVADMHNYLQGSQLLCEEKKEVSFVIMENEIAVGRIGLHYIHQQNKHAAIGYWLAKEAEGKGIMTTA